MFERTSSSDLTVRKEDGGNDMNVGKCQHRRCFKEVRKPFCQWLCVYASLSYRERESFKRELQEIASRERASSESFKRELQERERELQERERERERGRERLRLVGWTKPSEPSYVVAQVLSSFVTKHFCVVFLLLIVQ